MGIFLTEARRTDPTNKQKPGPKHPWRASIKVDVQEGRQPSRPVHPSGSEGGEAWHHSAGMASGCGFTLPHRTDWNQ